MNASGTANRLPVKPPHSARSSPFHQIPPRPFRDWPAPIARLRSGRSARLSSAAANAASSSRLDDQRRCPRRRSPGRRRPRSPPPAAPPPSPRSARSEIARCPTTRAKMSNWPIQRAGSARKPGISTRAATPFARASAAIRSLSGPSPTMTSRACRSVIAAEGADQPRQILDRAQAGHGADHDLAGLAIEALYSSAWAARRSARPGRRWECAPRLRPQALRATFSSRAEGTTSSYAAAQPEPAVAVALRVQPLRLVLVEPVLMMDERRRRRTAPRHHRVERAPIIGQHQIEAAHIAGQSPQAQRARRPVSDGASLGKRASIAWRSPRARRVCPAWRSAWHARRVAERVHQPHRPRLLAAQREGRMAMEDAHRRHAPLWRGGGACATG